MKIQMAELKFDKDVGRDRDRYLVFIEHLLYPIYCPLGLAMLSLFYGNKME